MIGSLLFVIMRLFFFNLEKGVALDGAKTTVEFQQERLASLEAFMNESIKNCTVSVVEFERIMLVKYGVNIHWDEKSNSWTASGFGLRVIKKDSCIEEIRLVGEPRV